MPLRFGRGSAPAEGQAIPPQAKALAASIFFAIAATNILTPLLPTIAAEFQLPYWAIGLFVASYVIARLLVSLAAGQLIDLFGQVRTASAGAVLLVIAGLVGWMAPSLELLVVSRVVAGLGIGIITTLALAALSDVAPDASRARVMSLSQIAHNAGIAVYPIVGGLIGAAFDWRICFAVIAAGGAMSAIFLLPVVSSGPLGTRPPDGPVPGAHADVSSRRKALSYSAIYGGVFAVMFNRHGFRNTLLPLYAGAVLGLGPIALATAITGMSVIGVLVAMPGAELGDRIGHRRVIAAGLAALAIGDFAFLFTGNYVTFLLAAGALGLGDFFIGSQTAVVAETAPAGQRARAIGRFRLATDVGALVGPLALAGAMDALGPQAAIVAAVLVLLLASGISKLAIDRPAS